MNLGRSLTAPKLFLQTNVGADVSIRPQFMFFTCVDMAS